MQLKRAEHKLNLVMQHHRHAWHNLHPWTTSATVRHPNNPYNRLAVFV
jgi:hypothetical protein